MEKEDLDQKKKKNSEKRSSKSIKKNMRESSLQEIGEKLGLTRMRICQLEKLILKKIRDSKSLDEFK
jgi:DNA-directed RNA polymerase sigma subunit (sigma70/sigma32)